MILEGRVLNGTAFPRVMKYDARVRFRQLAAQWKEQSRHMSNAAQMAMLKPYQQIIGMGDAVVPLLLEELQRDFDQWFCALEAITQENPVPPQAAGKILLVAEEWVAWGKRHGHIAA